MSDREITALLDLVADEVSSNWEIRRRYPFLSIVEIVELRRSIGKIVTLLRTREREVVRSTG